MHSNRRLALPAALVALGFLACSPETPAPADLAVQYAKGGSKGGGGTGPAVTSTSPTVARQDTTLNVRVLGSGFDSGSTVSFAIHGTVSAKLVVNATSFVSSSELIASVSVAPDADTVKYDVVVATTLGKKGIGSELFAVVSADPNPDWLFPATDAGLAVLGDGAFGDAQSYSLYRNRSCGVETRIFYGGSGDAIIASQSTSLKSQSKTCKAYPRTITLKFPDGTVEKKPFFANVTEIARATYRIPIGETVKRAMNIQSGTRCGVLRYRTTQRDSNTYFGADSVAVTRIDGHTYEVATQPYPNDKAFCDSDGTLVHMPLRFRIATFDPLP